MFQPLNPTAAIRWLSIRNTTFETLPAWGICIPTGVEFVNNQAVIKVGKPSLATAGGGISYGTTFSRWFMVNGPCDVPANGFGPATFDSPVYARIAGAITVFAGQQWGPAPNSWALRENYPGATCLGGQQSIGGMTADSRVLVAFGPIGVLWGKTTAQINKGSLGAVDIVLNASPGVSRGQLLATNAHLPNVLVNKTVVLQWIDSAWYIVSAEA